MVTFIAVLVALASFTAVQAPQAGAAPPRLDTSSWDKYEAPFRLAGPIYYVGTQELAAFLVSSPQGHILIDGGIPGAAAVIEKSIRDLGFKPEDIRILLTTQAHFDHVGTHAHFKKLSGATVQAMIGDDKLLRDGGKSDYLFGGAPENAFPRVAVDRVLKDGDIVTIGGARITARHTPGHTPGSTTYEMTVNEGGRDYKVVFAASTTVNPGTRLVTNPSYPTILEDFQKTFRVLESLQPDIFVSGHASFFNLKAKRAKMNPESPAAAFVDPEGYRALLAEKKKAFEALVAKEESSR
ncbi:MAG: subclass B3 metallo-beta-lactamase [Acidobacteriota bacterium]|nr:subclass B3 metallo-beta-lactamase [Acidobacteriota bacterium]MDQ3417265.1 subclass B3 metallo-beta-lactamase [Acidobacteriota bacterium]